jgi:hypothetical protein
MDPVTMAAVTAAGLFAKKLVEEAGGQAGRNLSEATGRLVAWLRRRGEQDPETSAALTMVQARATDPARVEVLGQVLATRAADDPQLARELAELVGHAERAGDVQVLFGGAHVNGGVHDHATVEQAGRDQIRIDRLAVQVGGSGLPAGGLVGLLRGRNGRVWNIPVPVRSFVGRDPQLTDLRQRLTSQHRAAQVPTTVLHGMGGVGKTQLALAYAHRHQGQYGLGWWIPAETEMTIATAMTGLASELGLPADLAPQGLAARLAGLLADEDGWLLVRQRHQPRAA